MQEFESRKDISEEYKWRLEDIFPSDEAWENEYAQLEKMLPALEALKGTLINSADDLASGLKLMDDAELMLERLYVYSRMRRDENNAEPKYQALFERAVNLNIKVSCATSFVSPLISSLNDDVILKYIDECPELKNYEFMLKELIRGKKHILSDKEERLMALLGDFSDNAHDIFSMLNNADIKFKSVHVNGEEKPLTHGSYIVHMQNPDREVRKEAYENLYSSFKQLINTIAATYATNVKKSVFYTRARGYENVLSYALFGNNVPVELYENLIKIVHEYLPEMYRYIDIRKKMLKIDDLAMYDIYMPLVAESSKEYSYEEAVDMVVEGLKPLGEEYGKILKDAFKQGWVDVYETAGKTSGAYSWGVYGTHPYVLLNHRGDLDSVFTIAHEMGHAMHTYYSNKNQPYPLAGYTIFVAEVASTVNEILLTKYLLKTVTDENLKKYVLNHFIDQFRTTVFRQTMFAEFEKIVHEMAEKGEPLTADSMTKVYGDLNALYYGDAIKRDDTICYEWARIPHFYTAFYVYKYATGFSCAVQIANNIEKPGMLEKYIKFLSSGGSDHPLELLKIAGVDLVSGEPVKNCMLAFKAALDEFEKMI